MKYEYRILNTVAGSYMEHEQPICDWAREGFRITHIVHSNQDLHIVFERVIPQTELRRTPQPHLFPNSETT